MRTPCSYKMVATALRCGYKSGMPTKLRVKMPIDMNKDVTVRLRITPEEHTAWLAAAELEQMTLSQWIRRRCHGLAAAAPTMPAAPKKTSRR